MLCRISVIVVLLYRNGLKAQPPHSPGQPPGDVDAISMTIALQGQKRYYVKRFPSSRAHTSIVLSGRNPKKEKNNRGRSLRKKPTPVSNINLYELTSHIVIFIHKVTYHFLTTTVLAVTLPSASVVTTTLRPFCTAERLMPSIE